MKEKIIEKQDEIIANLKEVGQLYFRIKDKATKQDVARMASLTIKGRTLESELIILKAQDISVETTLNQEVEKRISERMPSDELIEEIQEKSLIEYDNAPICEIDYYSGFEDGCKWLRSRLTCSEKPNNSKGGEG
jgi:hypothetical protein